MREIVPDRTGPAQLPGGGPDYARLIGVPFPAGYGGKGTWSDDALYWVPAGGDLTEPGGQMAQLLDPSADRWRDA